MKYIIEVKQRSMFNPELQTSYVYWNNNNRIVTTETKDNAYPFDTELEAQGYMLSHVTLGKMKVLPIQEKTELSEFMEWLEHNAQDNCTLFHMTKLFNKWKGELK